MNIPIDYNSPVPVYMQIYSTLKNKIVSGAFPHGTKLPSKRSLAEDCGVSISTIEHAYSVLRDEDYCETRERSGHYVTYSPERNFPTGVTAGKINTPNPKNIPVQADIPFSAFAGRMRKVLSDYGERVLMKSDYNGCPELREAISLYLMRSRNINVRPEQVIIGSGAEYLYGICIQMLGRERIIALENPSYEKIKAVYTANGAVCDMLAMDSEGILPEELSRTAATVLHVTPFNSFPSNITTSAQRRKKYIEWSENRNAFIIEDDYDSEFILTGTAPETLFSMCPDGKVIYINTFSKTIAPSMRAGYMLLPENLLPLYQEKTGFYSCTVPVLEQYFLAEWINSGDFERNINRMRRRKKSGK